MGPPSNTQRKGRVLPLPCRNKEAGPFPLYFWAFPALLTDPRGALLKDKGRNGAASLWSERTQGRTLPFPLTFEITTGQPSFQRKSKGWGPPISPFKEPRAGPFACTFERTKGPTLQETEEGTQSSGSSEDYWAIARPTRSTNDPGNPDVAMHIRIIRIIVNVLHLFIGGNGWWASIVPASSS